MLQVSKKLLPRSKGEWPSGLRLCNKNRKVPGSKLARCLAGLRDPTSLQGSRWPSGRMWTKAVINIGLVRLSPWEWPKVDPRAAKWQFKKKKKYNILFILIITIFLQLHQLPQCNVQVMAIAACFMCPFTLFCFSCLKIECQNATKKRQIYFWTACKNFEDLLFHQFQNEPI